MYAQATLSLLHCNWEWTRQTSKFWEIIKLHLQYSYTCKDTLDLLVLTHLTCLDTDKSVTVALWSAECLPQPAWEAAQVAVGLGSAELPAEGLLSSCQPSLFMWGKCQLVLAEAGTFTSNVYFLGVDCISLTLS